LQFHEFNEVYLERLCSGDFRTETHFVAYFSELIQLKLRSRVKSPQAVEDLRQETFARFFATLRSQGIRQPERLGAFVNSVCNNVLLEHYRSDSRENPAEEEEGVRKAAVALIFRIGQQGALELLFIKRAEYPGDPWSGQIAFPGGREEARDASLAETAIRETREETEIDLEREGMMIGTLDDLRPHDVLDRALAAGVRDLPRPPVHHADHPSDEARQRGRLPERLPGVPQVVDRRHLCGGGRAARLSPQPRTVEQHSDGGDRQPRPQLVLAPVCDRPVDRHHRGLRPDPDSLLGERAAQAAELAGEGGHRLPHSKGRTMMNLDARVPDGASK